MRPVYSTLLSFAVRVLALALGAFGVGVVVTIFLAAVIEVMVPGAVKWTLGLLIVLSLFQALIAMLVAVNASRFIER